MKYGITYFEFRKYLYDKYFVSYDTEHIKNMCNSKLMTKREIINLLKETL